MFDAFKILKIVTECEDCSCENEDDLENNADIADVEADLLDAYADVEELGDEEDIEYTEEMVHVFARPSGSYIVESDLLGKYMESNGIKSVKEAISNIAEFNKIDADSITLLVESSDYVSELIEEAKSMKDSKKVINQGTSTAKFLKDVKTEGIKVAKKKSKKKK